MGGRVSMVECVVNMCEVWLAEYPIEFLPEEDFIAMIESSLKDKIRKVHPRAHYAYNHFDTFSRKSHTNPLQGNKANRNPQIQCISQSEIHIQIQAKLQHPENRHSKAIPRVLTSYSASAYPHLTSAPPHST